MDLLSYSEITSFFGLSRYLDRTFAQQIGSEKVMSKSEFNQCRQMKRNAADSGDCHFTLSSSTPYTTADGTNEIFIAVSIACFKMKQKTGTTTNSGQSPA